MIRNTLPWLILLVMSIGLAPLQADDTEQDYQQLFQQGIHHYKNGDYDQAIYFLNVVRQKYPRNPQVISYLKKAQSEQKAGVVKKTMESELSKLIITDFEVENADLTTIFDYLRQKSTELSDGEFTANFIYRGTKEDLEEARVTLKLSTVPMTELLRYIGEGSNTHFRYEQHAVVATPRRMMRVNPTDAASLNASKDSPFSKSSPF